MSERVSAPPPDLAARPGIASFNYDDVLTGRSPLPYKREVQS
jgi:hypothetical protein